MVEEAIQLAEAHLRDIKPGDKLKSHKLDTEAGTAEPSKKRNKKKPKSGLSDQQAQLCRDKSACMAFNGSGCSQSADHKFGRIVLKHICAKCDSTAHGLGGCTK